MLRSYLSASKVSGRPLPNLLLEALILRLTGLKLGLSEYIDFQLYKDDISFAQKKKFAGQRAQAIIEDILIDDYSKILSLDKVSMYGLLQGLNIPTPKIKATYRTLRPSCITQIHSQQEMAEFLSDPTNLPCYVKRAFGAYGRGNVLIEESDGNTVQLANGVKESVKAFCNNTDDGRTLGWIFQEPLTSHKDIEKLTGTTKVSGVRVHTFLSVNGVQVTRAMFKINQGKRDSDNFEHGASGNMLAAVDVDTGQITRAIAGTGLKQVSLTKHPETGQSLVGFILPYWQEIRRIVIDGQKAFPGFLCPGWDIAICNDGPKVLEVNAFGDIDLSQHAYRQPFVDEAFEALLAQRGLKNLLYSGNNDEVSPRNHRRGIRKHHWLW